MLSFLKVVLRGVICTILLPVILLVWVLYGVYCLIIFVVMFIKSVVLFFTGEKMTGELKEDLEAKRILLEKEQAQIEQNQMMSMMYQNMTVQQQMLNQAMLQQQAFQQTQQMPFQQNAEIINPQQDDFNPFGEDPLDDQQTNDGEGGSENV